jgi:hypothetical protein
MTATLRAPDLPAAFRDEIARLHRAGFPLLPLGGGADGKAPLVSGWAGDGRLSLAQIFGPLNRTGSTVFGIRLDGLVVLDADDASPALAAELTARFGASPVQIQTPRGQHLYYRAPDGPLPNLRGEGLPVDVKSGRAFVVGPGSVRPDGGCYRPLAGILGETPLPVLRLDAAPAAPSARVPVGQRHAALLRAAVAAARDAADPDALRAALARFRETVCADPASLPDSELAAVASWAWRLRLENRLFAGRESGFFLPRAALDALREFGNESDAVGLFVLLTDLHGHAPGRRFALDFGAMRSAGLTRLSVARLRAARRTLERAGLLRLVGRHAAGRHPQTFVLTRQQNVAANLSLIPGGQKGGG